MTKNKKNNEKKKIDYKYNLSVYWGFAKKYKWLFGFVLAVGFLSQLAQAADKYLFKIIIDRGTEFANNAILVDVFVKALMIVGAVFISLIILKSILSWLFLHLMNRLSNNMIVDLKRKFFNHILSLSHSFHTSNKTGSLISRLGRGAGAVERMTDVVAFNFTPLVFGMIIVGGSLAYFSLTSALVLLITAVVFVTYSFILLSVQKKYLIAANNQEDFEKGNVADIFTNVDSVKYFGKDSKIIQKFKKITEATKKAYLKSWDFWRWIDAGQTFILATGTFFLVYFPLMSFLHGESSLGTLVFIYTIYGNIFWPLYSFIHGIRGFYRSMADFDALFQYGKIEKEVKDKPGAKNADIKKGRIEFRNIKFGYKKRKIFDNLNLKVPAGKKIALVGHSGCGKTTLVKLLYRFYDLNDGKILIDGESIDEFKQESLREEMSTVPQEAILFDDTVYNNVKFSNPSATRKEVMAAIKFAQLDKIIKDFPKKEDTIVGERGVKLSGGEKQRVSIARAILANKKILVLDEATSSLDSETEAEIQRDLEKLMENRTSIIIAHRLSTIMQADTIVVMKKGKIIQMGTHEELIQEGGEYKKLWNLQRGGYI